MTREGFVVDLRRFLYKLSQDVVALCFCDAKRIVKENVAKNDENQENDIKNRRKLVIEIVLTN